MTAITGFGALAATRTAPTRRTGPAGFRVPAGDTPEAAPLLAVSMPSLLGLQEAQGDAVSDREARRHADEMLDTLKDIQRELLGGTPRDSAARLAQLTRRTPPAADPALLAVQKALALRAAVETARHRPAASQ